jgi:hypothetical protein
VEIRLLETAREDLREGWKSYEKDAVGRGDYFLDCIQIVEIYAILDCRRDPDWIVKRLDSSRKRDEPEGPS